jgi:TldD protein
VRVVRRRDESISVKSGKVEGVAMGETDGFGVRVLVDGAWGFASSDTLELGEADRVGALAVRIAKASATALRNRVALDSRPPATGTYETPVVEDPFKIPLERKISDLVDADRAVGAVKGVTFTESVYTGHREWKTFAATDGSFTEQVITQVGAAVEANAIEGDEHQRRSWPMPPLPAAWARSAGTTRASRPRRCRSSRTAASWATSPAARPRRASAAAPAAACAPTAGTASR